MKKYVPWLYLALGLSQAAHSIEEVITGLWRWMPRVTGALQAGTAWVPVLRMPEQTFVVGNMLIITVLLAFSPFLFINRTWAWRLAALVAIVELVNGTGHISMALALGAYFPGCVSAVALLAFSLLYIWAFKRGRKEPDEQTDRSF
jgi:hypothetical protein